MSKFPVILCYLQAVYFVVTGLWPVFHIDSFIVVTAPKTDLWLVRALGVQITVIGITLFTAAFTKKISLPVIVLAAGSAAGFAAIDIYYAYFKDRISNIYLADAAAQLMLLTAWIIAVIVTRKKNNEGSYV